MSARMIKSIRTDIRDSADNVYGVVVIATLEDGHEISIPVVWSVRDLRPLTKKRARDISRIFQNMIQNIMCLITGVAEGTLPE